MKEIKVDSLLSAGVIKDPRDDRDYVFTEPILSEDKMVKYASMPIKIDHSDKMSTVKFQGGLGSCIAFSACAVKEWQETVEHEREVKEGKEDHREGEEYNLSEQWVYWNCKKIDPWPESEGTNIRSALKVLNKIGTPTEEGWPYTPDKINIGEPESWAHLIARWYKIGSYWRISGIEDIKIALLEGPLIIGFACFEEIYGKLENGVIPYPANSGQVYGHHAVCAVGYDNEKKLLKFKNSWSVYFGDKGYGYLPYKYVEDFVIDSWIARDISVTNEMLKGKVIPIEKIEDETVNSNSNSNGELRSYINELSPLKELPKIHYSFALPKDLDEDTCFEIARITHALSFSAENSCSQELIDKYVRVCKRVNELSPLIPASLCVNYSPWHRKFSKTASPLILGQTAIDEITYFQELAVDITMWLKNANDKYDTNVVISMLAYDSERFKKVPSDSILGNKMNEAIKSKFDMFHDIGKCYYGSHVEISWYGRGKIQWNPNAPIIDEEWWTGRGKNEFVTSSLYWPAEPDRMRQVLKETTFLADKMKAEIAPWLSLGSGYNANKPGGWGWDREWDYPLSASYSMGKMLNEHHRVKYVLFYPMFYSNYPYFVEHFCAFVKGANNELLLESSKSSETKSSETKSSETKSSETKSSQSTNSQTKSSKTNSQNSSII